MYNDAKILYAVELNRTIGSGLRWLKYQMSSLRVTMVGLYVCRKVEHNMKSIMLSMGDGMIGRKTESAMMNVLPIMF
jgi:hypothetical protein